MSIIRSIGALALFVPTAFAADNDANGCDDTYEGNDACVASTAAVDGSSTIGANSDVGDYATVGPGLALGANVVLAPRASLAGRDVHPSTPLPVGDGVIIGRRTTVGLDADLGAGTVLSRAVTVGRDLATGVNASVGYGSTLGDGVNLGANSTVGSLVQLGDHASVGNLAVIARDVTVAPAASPATGSEIDGIVGPGTTIGDDVLIESGARVRKFATIGSGVTVESTARIGRDVTVGADATIRGTIRANAIVGEGATVENGATVNRGATVCDGATVPGTESVPGGGLWPAEGCVVHTSCLSILESGGSTGDGVYQIDPDGSGAFDAWCDMSGGGWTLAMRFADNTNTFTFLSPYWTNASLLDPTSMDPTTNTDAKHRAYIEVPGDEIRGCLRDPSTGTYGCKDYDLPATRTLQEVFVNTPIGSRNTGRGYFFNESDAGEVEWLTMWGRTTSEPTSGFPFGYQDTGINIDDDQSNYRARVRFGLALNNEVDINTMNDAVGFGASAYYDSGTGGLVESPWRVSAGAAFGETLVRTRGTIWVR